MMMPTSLVAARTGKFIKNESVFERGENLLQNGHFVFRFSQFSEIALES